MSLLRLITFRQQAEAGEPVLFTPSQITTELWLDASDSSTITLNGSNVSQWNDKSGNGRNVSQPTAANQPVLTLAGQNGLDVLTFDGTKGLFSANGALQLASLVCFVVYRPLNRNCVIVGISHSTTHTSPWFRWVIYPLGTNLIQYRINGAVVQGGNQSSNYTILSLSTGNTEAFLNGTQVLSGIQRTMTYPNSTPFLVGQNVTGGERLNGTIAEIVIVNNSISSLNREKMEGYLAHKWGLTASLPEGHPYKTTVPYV